MSQQSSQSQSQFVPSSFMSKKENSNAASSILSQPFTIDFNTQDNQRSQTFFTPLSTSSSNIVSNKAKLDKSDWMQRNENNNVQARVGRGGSQNNNNNNTTNSNNVSNNLLFTFGSNSSNKNEMLLFPNSQDFSQTDSLAHMNLNHNNNKAGISSKNENIFNNNSNNNKQNSKLDLGIHSSNLNSTNSKNDDLFSQVDQLLSNLVPPSQSKKKKESQQHTKQLRTSSSVTPADFSTRYKQEISSIIQPEFNKHSQKPSQNSYKNNLTNQSQTIFSDLLTQPSRSQINNQLSQTHQQQISFQNPKGSRCSSFLNEQSIPAQQSQHLQLHQQSQLQQQQQALQSLFNLNLNSTQPSFSHPTQSHQSSNINHNSLTPRIGSIDNLNSNSTANTTQYKVGKDFAKKLRKHQHKQLSQQEEDIWATPLLCEDSYTPKSDAKRIMRTFDDGQDFDDLITDDIKKALSFTSLSSPNGLIFNNFTHHNMTLNSNNSDDKKKNIKRDGSSKMITEGEEKRSQSQILQRRQSEDSLHNRTMTTTASATPILNNNNNTSSSNTEASKSEYDLQIPILNDLDKQVNEFGKKWELLNNQKKQQLQLLESEKKRASEILRANTIKLKALEEQKLQQQQSQMQQIEEEKVNQTADHQVSLEVSEEQEQEGSFVQDDKGNKFAKSKEHNDDQSINDQQPSLNLSNLPQQKQQTHPQQENKINISMNDNNNKSGIQDIVANIRQMKQNLLAKRQLDNKNKEQSASETIEELKNKIRSKIDVKEQNSQPNTPLNSTTSNEGSITLSVQTISTNSDETPQAQVKDSFNKILLPPKIVSSTPDIQTASTTTPNRIRINQPKDNAEIKVAIQEETVKKSSIKAKDTPIEEASDNSITSKQRQNQDTKEIVKDNCTLSSTEKRDQNKKEEFLYPSQPDSSPSNVQTNNNIRKNEQKQQQVESSKQEESKVEEEVVQQTKIENKIRQENKLENSKSNNQGEKQQQSENCKSNKTNFKENNNGASCQKSILESKSKEIEQVAASQQEVANNTSSKINLPKEQSVEQEKQSEQEQDQVILHNEEEISSVDQIGNSDQQMQCLDDVEIFEETNETDYGQQQFEEDLQREYANQVACEQLEKKKRNKGQMDVIDEEEVKQELTETCENGGEQEEFQSIKKQVHINNNNSTNNKNMNIIDCSEQKEQDTLSQEQNERGDQQDLIGEEEYIQEEREDQQDEENEVISANEMLQQDITIDLMLRLQKRLNYSSQKQIRNLPLEYTKEMVNLAYSILQTVRNCSAIPQPPPEQDDDEEYYNEYEQEQQYNECYQEEVEEEQYDDDNQIDQQQQQQEHQQEQQQQQL